MAKWSRCCLEVDASVRRLWKRTHNMKQTQTIPETFLGVGHTRDRARVPYEAVRVPVPRPAADRVLIRVAASPLNTVHKLATMSR